MKLLSTQNLFENSITLIYLSCVSKQNLISIIISLIPISYILGTFILNLNIFLLILIGLFLYAKGYRYKIELLDKLIILFFIYILFTGLWNTIELKYFNSKYKYRLLYFE